MTGPLEFFGGKGGVGKTTLATARATGLADAGLRTLLVSTDPAHSTADLLDARLTDQPTAVADRLWAVEIDPEADARRYVERIKRDAQDTVSREVMPAVERHLDLAVQSPGTVESALLDRFVDLIDTCPGEYERVVFDTAPTGHTLRLLTLPTLLTGWVEGLVRQREQVRGMDRALRNLAGDDRPDEDPVVTRLRHRRDRLRGARDRLQTDAAFWLVAIPERLPIEETARAWQTLSHARVAVGGVLVNRVLPEQAGSGWLDERLAQQTQYLDEIDERFADLPRGRITHQPRDITTPEQLAHIADQLATALAR